MTWLAKIIQKLSENEGGVVAYIYGEIGSGKTSYALYTAKELYGNWEEVLNWLVFDLDELLPKLAEQFERGERIPLIIIDDAGLWANRMYWWEPAVREFTKLFNVIRSIAGGVIFTTPTDEIPRQLIKKVKYRLHITRAGIGLGGIPMSRAVIYEQYVMPDFTPKVKKIAEEIFPTYYPIYDEYKKKRYKAIANKLRIMMYKKGIGSGEHGKVEMKGNVVLEVIGRATSMLKDGATPKEVKDWLVELGLPNGTAWHWVYRIRELIGKDIDPVEAVRSGIWRINIRKWSPVLERTYKMKQ